MVSGKTRETAFSAASSSVTAPFNAVAVSFEERPTGYRTDIGTRAFHKAALGKTRVLQLPLFCPAAPSVKRQRVRAAEILQL